MSLTSIALGLVAVCAAAAAIAFGNLAFGVFAVVALLLVGASAAGPGRIVSRCRHLEGRAARVLIWGTVPRDCRATELTVKRIWALGAGLHFNLATGQQKSLVHVKVAQPREWTIGPNAVTIADAKYVQVNGTTIERVVGSAAFEIILDQHGLQL